MSWLVASSVFQSSNFSKGQSPHSERCPTLLKIKTNKCLYFFNDSERHWLINENVVNKCSILFKVWQVYFRNVTYKQELYLQRVMIMSM